MKRASLIIASGLLVALSFPPFDVPGVIGLIGFIIGATQVVTAPKPLLHGLLFGFSYFLLLLQWMSVVGTDAWIGLAIICAIWWGAAFAIIAKLPMTSAWALKASSIFTAAELLRDRVPFGGFGWGQIGVLSANTFFKSLVPVIGQIGLTLLFSAIAFETARIWMTKTYFWRSYLVVALLCVLSMPLGSFMVRSTPSEELSVSLVQGGVVHTGLGTFGPVRSVLKKHVEVSQENLETLMTSDLVIWPESSSDLDPFLDTESHRLISNLQKLIKKPLLIGANVELPGDGVANTSILWDEAGSTIIYQKRRLVPFGEFLPFRDTIAQLTDRAALMPRDFVAGNKPGLVTVNGVQLSVVICFEIADDSLAFDNTKDSAAIIVHTNNATYQNLGQSEQQLISAQMRALETNRPVLSVSTSGISAVIDENGTVIKSLSQSTVGVLTSKVVGKHGATPAMILHPFLLVGILLFALWQVISLVRQRRVAS